MPCIWANLNTVLPIFRRITATDIINRSGLNRSTFYAHYPDVKGIIDELSGAQRQRAYIAMAIVYIVLVALISLGVKLMERSLRKSDRRN